MGPDPTYDIETERDKEEARKNAAILRHFRHRTKLDSLATTPGRNEPCPCGSGKKYKRCCL